MQRIRRTCGQTLDRIHADHLEHVGERHPDALNAREIGALGEICAAAVDFTDAGPMDTPGAVS